MKQPIKEQISQLLKDLQSYNVKAHQPAVASDPKLQNMALKLMTMYKRPGQDSQAENNIFIDIFKGSIAENMKFYYQEIDRQALEI